MQRNIDIAWPSSSHLFTDSWTEVWKWSARLMPLVLPLASRAEALLGAVADGLLLQATLIASALRINSVSVDSYLCCLWSYCVYRSLLKYLKKVSWSCMLCGIIL